MVRTEQKTPKSSKGRIRFVLIFMTIFGMAILLRLFYLQAFRHDYYVRIAASQHWAKDEIPAQRGRIYVKDDDVEGGLYPLAENQTLQLVFAAPEEIKDKDDAARKISPIIGIEEKKIAELLKNNHTYVLLQHQLTYEQQDKIKALDIKGIGMTAEPIRYYPEGTLASQLLGYVNEEGDGQYGIEEFFDGILKGVPGLYKTEISAGGKTIAFGNNVSVEPKNGTDVVLTINRDVQTQAEKLIADSVKKFSAEGGSISVMDPATGDIIAMANYPTYDPNKYKEVKNYELFKNKSVTDEYEPGSIFKVITLAAGLDLKKIEPTMKFNDTGSVKLDGYTIMNSDRKAHGEVDMTYVLAMSLNTGTIQTLNLMGKNAFYGYLQKFHFGKKTGIEQPSEGVGSVHNPKDVNNHTYATISFGQSISTTPIQMLASFAAVANGGKLVKPHLVAETITPSGKKEETKTEVIDQVLSKESTKKLTEMMIQVVEVGHGKQAKVAGYKVAGKTGTAQVPAKNGRGYDASKNIGSFIGFAPARSPRFVVMAKVDSPKGVPWAEESAAPVVGKMMDFLLKYYQVPPTEAVK
jgi:stage V sporulation protein D (sporulation-specific penicillin-binding protein)